MYETTMCSGFFFVGVDLCSDVADCASRAAAVSATVERGELSFDAGSDEAGWTGQVYASSGSNCSGTVTTSVMTFPEDSALRISSEKKEVTSIPRDADGLCDSEHAFRLAKSQECERLEVIGAAFAQEI